VHEIARQSGIASRQTGIASILSAVITPILAITIATATLLLILLRPRRLPEPVAATCGALAMLTCGLVDPLGAVWVLLGSWNVFLFFLGLMVASCVAERAGVFEVAAGLMARLAGGSARWLLV
jgi:Na+/H+ antiporter NhaD/arsenite permease-like protein